MRRFPIVLAVLLLVGIGIGIMPGCAALNTGVDSPSAQVLADVRQAETAFLVAQTIVNVRSHGKVSQDVKDAEAIIFNYLTEAKVAAEKGSVVTASDKLDLFNKALKDFNDKYTQ